MIHNNPKPLHWEFLTLSCEIAGSSKLCLLWIRISQLRIRTASHSLIDKTFKNQRSLRIEKIDPKNYHDIFLIVRRWGKLAEEKEKIANTSEEEDALTSCQVMCLGIQRSVEDPHPSQEVYACKDEERNIHGLIVLSIGGTFLNVAHLTTHPNNIRSLNDKEANQVQGVGSILLKKAEEIAIEKNLQGGIILSPTPSAIAFYEKQRFNLAFDSDGIPEMRKPLDQIDRSKKKER